MSDSEPPKQAVKPVKAVKKGPKAAKAAVVPADPPAEEDEVKPVNRIGLIQNNFEALSLLIAENRIKT